jgi:hypothetical protein
MVNCLINYELITETYAFDFPRQKFVKKNGSGNYGPYVVS